MGMGMEYTSLLHREKMLAITTYEIVGWTVEVESGSSEALPHGDSEWTYHGLPYQATHSDIVDCDWCIHSHRE